MSKIIEIIFEDNHLLVVVKPPNVLSQADKSGDADMLTRLKADLKIRHQKPGNVFLGLVHRLDRPVGGVMVFAKTSKAASRLSECIRTRAMKKNYLTIVHDRPKKQSDALCHHLWKDRKENKVFVVSAKKEDAKEARLQYRFVCGDEALSLLEINLETGRPHQIRVQLADIGHPLYGDQKYANKKNKAETQLALWSYKLRFPHPTTKKMLEFYSLPPLKLPWSIFNIDPEHINKI